MRSLSLSLLCLFGLNLSACGGDDPPPIASPGGGGSVEPAPMPPPDAAPRPPDAAPRPPDAPPADLSYPFSGGGPKPGNGECSLNLYQPYLCPDGACATERDTCSGMIMACGEKRYHCYEGFPVSCCDHQFAACPKAQPYLCVLDGRCARLPGLCPHRFDRCDYQGRDCVNTFRVKPPRMSSQPD